MDKLLGMTFLSVTQGDDSITFKVNDDHYFKLEHQQDCCESVYIEDVAGDLQDLVGTPILLSEEAYEAGDNSSEYGDSSTWSFFKLATVKGHVTIRFFGSSNGYYGETASLYEFRSGARIW